MIMTPWSVLYNKTFVHKMENKNVQGDSVLKSASRLKFAPELYQAMALMKGGFFPRENPLC